MKTLLLAALIATLGACTTVSNTQAPNIEPVVFENGSTPSFVIGDCIRISDKYAKDMRSDGTPKQVIYVDDFATVDGGGGYIVRMVHPRIGHPTYHALNAAYTDERNVKTTCPKSE